MANPAAAEKGILMLLNPLDVPVTIKLRIPPYYTGLVESVWVEDGSAQTIGLLRDGSIDLEVTVAAGGHSWVTFE